MWGNLNNNIQSMDLFKTVECLIKINYFLLILKARGICVFYLSYSQSDFYCYETEIKWNEIFCPLQSLLYRNFYS